MIYRISPNKIKDKIMIKMILMMNMEEDT